VPADRAFPVRLAPAGRLQASRTAVHPAPSRRPVDPLSTPVQGEWHRLSPVVLQRIPIQATAAASQHGAAQSRLRTRNRYSVADLKASQLAPSQTGQRKQRQPHALAALTCIRQRTQLVQVPSLESPTKRNEGHDPQPHVKWLRIYGSPPPGGDACRPAGSRSEAGGRGWRMLRTSLVRPVNSGDFRP
jgi:hypothetical protein